MLYFRLIRLIDSKALTLVLVVAAFYAFLPYVSTAALTKRVYLTSGTSWTVPSDWSSDNIVEAIGSGGNGTGPLSNRGGGGGGAYARSDDVTLTIGASISYKVTGDVVFNSGLSNCPNGTVCADSGSNASLGSGGAGGTTANSTGTTVEYAGGAGANGGGGQSGGGGGAAGPGGAGGAASGGTGGTGGNGLGGAGGSPHVYDTELLSCSGGTNASSGTEYDTIPGHGSGGGGAGGFTVTGASNDCAPTSSASYGGGGGGGSAENAGGTGTSGIIVITYTSTEAGSSSTAKFKILGGSVQIIGGQVLIK